MLALIRRKKLTIGKLTLLFPLPFILLLRLAKSKIYWYLVFVLPFFSILAYLPLTRFQNHLLVHKLPYILIVILPLIFIKNTFFYQHKIKINEAYQIVQCLKKLPNEKTAYLVKKSERDNYQFLMKNNLYTETSFLYGGQPSLVFYANKKIDFFYQENEFLKKYSSYPIIVFKEDDQSNLGINIDAFNYLCSTKNQLENERWHVFIKSTIIKTD